MKRLSVICLAALLAACDTMGYPPDPYGYPGAGYPPYPPYPEGQPYPPGEPYPPSAPYPPGQTYPPYPGGQPYPPGEPYPPNSPYPPGQAYPPSGPYPPGPGYPPQQQPGFACPISTSGEWRAWINGMPGQSQQPILYVSGKVTTPTGGYQVAFEPYLQIAESYPVQAFATVRVVPPAQNAVQVVMTHNVSWQWPMAQPIGRVIIRCGDQTLAEISPTQRSQ